MKKIKTRYLVNPEGMVVEEIQEVIEDATKGEKTLHLPENKSDSQCSTMLLSFEELTLIPEPPGFRDRPWNQV